MRLIKINQTNFKKYSSQIADLLIKTFTSGYYHQQALDKEWADEYLHEVFRNGSYAYLALDKGKVIGSVILSPVPVEFPFLKKLKKKYDLGKCCFMSKLAVEKSHQKKGIGTRLLERIVGSINNGERHYLVVKTLFNNEPALNLYQKFGFRKSIVIKENVNKKDRTRPLYLKKQVLVKDL